MITHEHSPTFVAPSTLTIEHRLACRDAVLAAVESSARSGAHVVVVDLSATTEIDAAGLGILILMQKRARERGMRTRLVGCSREIRDLLDSTRLYTLFELGAGA